jgi:hypothetical protein
MAGAETVASPVAAIRISAKRFIVAPSVSAADSRTEAIEEATFQQANLKFVCKPKTSLPIRRRRIRRED